MGIVFYAQLNADNICISVCQLNNEVIASNLIRIPEYNESLLGKKYVGGRFIVVSMLEAAKIS